MYNILLISSKPPSHSAGLGQQIINALRNSGHNVDFLTRYKYPHMGENEEYVEKLSIQSRVKAQIKKFAINFNIYNCLKKIRTTINSVLGKSDSKYTSNNGLLFVYNNESCPDIPNSYLLSKIKRKYDAVITLFWQDMLNSTSLKAIYDEYKCPILIYSPDMAPMTGGCYYFGTCINFQNECGKCPALNSGEKSDQSNKNFLLKKNNYESINCVFLGNSWMNQYAQKSKLFSNVKKAEIIIDENIFKPVNKLEIRKKLSFPIDSFIILIRSSSDPRKGNSDILKAINLFLNSISEINRKEVIVLTIGDNYFKTISFKFPCEIMNLGQVDKNKLIECYQVADVFVNASYDDAGPSMINQSIMCGTPVVCYENGTALDVIENKISGYKTTTGDVEGLKDGLFYIYDLSEKDKNLLSKTTRNMALIHNSSKAFSQNITNIITSMISVSNNVFE